MLKWTLLKWYIESVDDIGLTHQFANPTLLLAKITSTLRISWATYFYSKPDLEADLHCTSTPMNQVNLQLRTDREPIDSKH